MNIQNAWVVLVILAPLSCSADRSEGGPDPAVDAGAVDSTVIVDGALDTKPIVDDGGLRLDSVSPMDVVTDASCKDMPADAGASPIVATIAVEYEPFYTAYDLGPVPGMPAGHLGGCRLAESDPNTLLLAGNSEASDGGIYSIKVKRGACGHIVGWEGTATKLADTPYVDANLLLLPSSMLLYSEWPQNKLGLLPSGATAPAREIDLGAVGIDSSIGGVGFVPGGYAAEGKMRGVTWSGGNWFHIDLVPDAPLWKVTGATKTTTLPNGPGGFAYVPAGSPGFAENRVILSEWSSDSVATYAVDGQGDPDVVSRKAFFSAFTKPWGAYFDPPTGDFLFLTWSSPPDRVYVVQGFSKPPPPPPPPR